MGNLFPSDTKNIKNPLSTMVRINLIIYSSSQANNTDSMENLPGEEKDGKDEEIKQEEEENGGGRSESSD